MSRKIRRFTEKDWFHWGAPRNLRRIATHWGMDCIYIRTLSRHAEVAFLGKVQYFGGGLMCLIPIDQAKDRNRKSNRKRKRFLETTVAFLNSTEFQTDYIYAGRFKIGQKQTLNVILPVNDGVGK